MNPVVSACIICYNQERYIGAAIKGASKQTVKGAYEIVISDDCSTDRTLEIAGRCAGQDARVRIESRSRNLGMHGNWAKAIAACKGKYIALCEGDDVWNDPEKLQKQIDLLEQNPEAVASFSNAHVMKDDGRLSKHPYVDKDLGMLDAREFLSLNFNPIPTCTTVFRKSAFAGFPPAYYKSPFADWVLHTLLIQKGPYIYIPELTSTYRQHDEGVWSGVNEEKQLLNKLKAIGIIESLADAEFTGVVLTAKAKQLDRLLYFYRDNKALLKYLRTWLRLKMLRSA